MLRPTQPTILSQMKKLVVFLVSGENVAQLIGAVVCLHAAPRSRVQLFVTAVNGWWSHYALIVNKNSQYAHYKKSAGALHCDYH